MGPLTPQVDAAQVRVPEWIELQAGLLRAAAAGADPDALEVLRFAGVAPQVPLSSEGARQAVARDHGYQGWADAATRRADVVDTRFEAAADAIHAGDRRTLERLLDEAPALVGMRSPFPHHQTLLHHLAANGIEVERQLRSPANAVELARLLLARGADPDAACDSYGGGAEATTLCLLVSSAHPAAAGVQAALVEELVRGGARVDGVEGGSQPLWTAVTFGYTDAAEALVRAGARVVNLPLAAALGECDAVQGYFDAGGGLRPGPAPGRIGTAGSALRPELVVDYALIWAAAHGRRQVVEYLLTKGPDLGVREPVFHATALGAARYFGHDAIVALLEG